MPDKKSIGQRIHEAIRSAGKAGISKIKAINERQRTERESLQRYRSKAIMISKRRAISEQVRYEYKQKAARAARQNAFYSNPLGSQATDLHGLFSTQSHNPYELPKRKKSKSMFY